MIYFLARREALWGIRDYLAVVGGRLAGTVKPISYESLLDKMIKEYWWEVAKEPWWNISHEFRTRFSSEALRAASTLALRLYKCLRADRALVAGTYIFADIERLSPEDAQKAGFLWKVLAESSGRIRLLNHPTHSMRRYELLRNLYERGVNKFNVYRITEARWPQRYPVFLRGENDHAGPTSPLLRTREELESALRELTVEGKSREGIIFTEFCDTADARNVYRKYGAFIVGEEIVPKHLTFSKYWANQGPDLLEEEMMAEEREYVRRNPHKDALREVCNMARINYGKIDYGVLNGELQIWEIATNPTINAPPSRRHPARRGILEEFDHKMTEAFKKLAGE